MTLNRFILLTPLVLAASLPSPAAASCGSAYCVINTQWDTQGMASQAGRFMADLRYEYIRQDRLRRGGRDISAAEDTADTTETRTVNQNLVAGLDYTFDRHWGVAASLPMAKRQHDHIADPTGAATPESWQFTRTGDARVLGRYQFDLEEPTNSVGLQFGLKLPTGGYRVANGEGVVAERALQPGTGSTDLVLGGYYAYRPQFRGLGWFGQALFQQAIATREDFRPGNQLSITGGINYPVSDEVTLLFQLNGLVKGRDTGSNAESDLSGGRHLYASPGVSFALTPDSQLYGFVQQPLVRNVNGVQLVARQALVVGLSLRF
ncbi:MAG TPA: hypothetical protein VJ576_17065 [Rhodocyclaceae bacterium]|nr:hypothetical protein [Rhodocyclaceae bacterium]